jgi:hypothetical protein
MRRNTSAELVPLKNPDVSICTAARMLSPPQTHSVRVNIIKRTLSTYKALVLQMPISVWTHPFGAGQLSSVLVLIVIPGEFIDRDRTGVALGKRDR